MKTLAFASAIFALAVAVAAPAVQAPAASRPPTASTVLTRSSATSPGTARWVRTPSTAWTGVMSSTSPHVRFDEILTTLRRRWRNSCILYAVDVLRGVGAPCRVLKGSIYTSANCSSIMGPGALAIVGSGTLFVLR